VNNRFLKEKKELIKKLVISLGITLISIFLLEILCRAFLVNSSEINVWGYNRGGLGDLLANKNFVSTEVEGLPYRVVTNSQGLRNVQNLSLPKQSNLKRILAVGDSFTFGSFVNNQDTYPALLEYELRKNNSKVEVINAGIAGYTLEDELSYLEEKGLKLESDLIILQVYQNDVADYQPQTRQVFSRKAHEVSSHNYLYQIAKNSAFLTYIQKKRAESQTQRYREESAKRKEPNLDFELAKYLKDLKRLENIVYNKNLKVIVLLIPSYDQIIDKTGYFPQFNIKESLGGRLFVVDFYPIFKEVNNPEKLYLLPENGHLSRYGNQVVVETLKDYIN
jgi:lysophospholipase L1-like esterase